MKKVTKVSSMVITGSLLASLMVPTVFGAEKSFSDIEKSYAKDAIIQLQAMGILNGTDSTHFNPKGTLTRAEFTAIIVRTLGLDAPEVASSFKDVKGWATAVIEAASKAGIIEGVGNGMFSPNGPLTREAAATILVRALQLQGELTEGDAITFTDADKISAWAKPFIAIAQHYGLINGNPDGTFGPKATTTREMAATMGINLLGSLDDVVKPVTPPVKDPGTVTPPTEKPPVVTPPSGGGYYYPVTPPVVTPPVVTPPVVEPPVVEPPVVEPPVVEPPADEVDVTLPVITLNGESVVNVVYGSEYVDAGATATDNKDGDIAGEIVATITNAAEETITAIDTTVAGVYTVHYNVSDAAGNVAVEVTRTVNVAEEVVTPPVEADLTAYNAALASVNEDVYTAASWEAYQVIVTANVVTAANTQAEVDAATAAITAAQANLVVKPVVVAPTVVSNVYTTPDGPERIMLSFEIDKDLDLATGDLSIKFLDVNGNEVKGANGHPVVKDKTWSGYLNNADGSVKYSKGDENNEDYINVLPANSIITTVITSASGYAGSAWYNAIATIEIEATDAVGQVSKASVNMEILHPEVYVTAQDFGRTPADVTYAVYGGYNLGFQINLANLSYDSIASVTGTVYDNDIVVGQVTANTQDRIDKYKAADLEYGDGVTYDGQLSFDFADAATLENYGLVADANGAYQSSYLEYTQPVLDDYLSGELLPTRATLVIVTKNGAVITINYTY